MGVRFDNCVKRGESAAERPMRIVHIKDRAASASSLDWGAQIDSRNSFRGEVRQRRWRAPLHEDRRRAVDTHWTFRGALAAFNAIVEADSHADWRIDPSS